MTAAELDAVLLIWDRTDPAIQRRTVGRLMEQLAALRLVHEEARELVGEADATGEIPQANLDALRALLWRASLRMTR